MIKLVTIAFCYGLAVSEGVYDDYQWTTIIGSSEKDRELIQNWNTTEDQILDLALVMDLTGSMSDWIEYTKNTLKEVIESVEETSGQSSICWLQGLQGSEYLQHP